MTYPIIASEKCAVCGLNVNVTIIASYSTSGCALDGRPRTLGADIIPMWIQHCPGCGYCSPDISKSPKDTSIVRSQEYQSIVSGGSIASFYKASALIKESEKDYESASFLYLRSAWMHEDYNEFEAAREMRSEALRCFDMVGEDGIEYNLHRMELLRTSGKIAAAIELYNNMNDSPKEYRGFLERIKLYLDAGSSEPDR